MKNSWEVQIISERTCDTSLIIFENPSGQNRVRSFSSDETQMRTGRGTIGSRDEVTKWGRCADDFVRHDGNLPVSTRRFSLCPVRRELTSTPPTTVVRATNAETRSSRTRRNNRTRPVCGASATFRGNRRASFVRPTRRENARINRIAAVSTTFRRR